MERMCIVLWEYVENLVTAGRVVEPEVEMKTRLLHNSLCRSHITYFSYDNFVLSTLINWIDGLQVAGKSQ